MKKACQMHNRRCIFGKPECEVTSLQYGHSVALSTHKQINKNRAIQMTRTLLDLRLSGKILLTSDWWLQSYYKSPIPDLIPTPHIIDRNNYGKRSLYKNVTIKLFFSEKDEIRIGTATCGTMGVYRHSEIGFCRSPIPLVDGKRHPHTQSQFLCLQTTDFLQQVSIVLS